MKLLTKLVELFLKILDFITQKMFTVRYEAKKELKKLDYYNYVKRATYNPFFMKLFQTKKVPFFNKTKLFFKTKTNNYNPSQSYAIVGNAGDGKSEMLVRAYLKDYKFSLRKIVFYFNAKQFKDLSLDSFSENIEKLSPRKVVLYIDGIDELGDDFEVDKFVNLLKLCQKYKFCIRLACREKFYTKKEISTIIYNYAKQSLKEYEFNWTKPALKKLTLFLLSCLHTKQRLSKKQKIEFINLLYANYKVIKNPLSLILLLYIFIKDSNNALLYSNEYGLFDKFCYELLHLNNSTDYISEKDLIAFSKKVFISHTKHSRLENTAKFKFLNPIFKNAEQHEITFIHQRFYEYFIAKFYVSMCKQRNKDVTLILTRNYTNDIADFITEAFLNESIDIRKEILQFLESLYNYLNYSSNANFTNELVANLNKIKMNHNNERFFFETEILFRMGRMDLPLECNTPIIDFLKKAYYKDIDFFDKDKEYRTCLYKRWCAISSSFIGGEEIELDYITRMLDFHFNEYNINYDLANRSHTLMYYGDVSDCVDFFDFKDNNTNQQCTKALNKRINRLSNYIPENVLDLDFSLNENRKLLRLYYFRAFDLATVYTFLKSRSNYTLIDKEQLDIIKKCKIEFLNMSKARQNLLYEIKNRILSILE